MAINRTNRARALPQSSGLAEDRVWARLRGGRVDGYKFRRQHPIGPYYADFACDRLRLVIEIDGGVHSRHDVILNDFCEALGWTDLRFTNDQVLTEPGRLLDAIRSHGRTAGL